MTLIWSDEKTSLCHKGRYFKCGEKIPAGILTKERIDEFIRKGQIESDSKKEPAKIEPVKPEITEKKSGNKSGKKSLFKNNDPEPEENEPVKKEEDDLQ